MFGVYFIDMVIFGGLFWVFVLELLKCWGVLQDWGFVVFGVFGVQVFISGINFGQGICNLFYWCVDWWMVNVEFFVLLFDVGVDVVVIIIMIMVIVDEVVFDGVFVFIVEGFMVQFGVFKVLDDVLFMVLVVLIMGFIGLNGVGKLIFVDVISGFFFKYGGWVLLGDCDLVGFFLIWCVWFGLCCMF